MSVLDYTCYYVGHGAMHYIKVMDDKETVVKKKILIDAGSINPRSNFAAYNRMAVLCNILDSTEGQCIFCLTHPHTDHYSYFIEIIKELIEKHKTNVLETFWIGGYSQEMFDMYVQKGDLSYYDENMKGLEELFDLIKSDAFTYDQIQFLSFFPDEPVLLWNNGDVYLGCLFANLFDDAPENVNDNSANYIVINDGTRNAIWVTGDATGDTFDRLLAIDKEELVNRIKSLLKYKNKVVMTVPHHGSYNTLNRHGFGDCDNQQECHVPDRWYKFATDLSIKNYILYLSADFKDQYKHPNGVALGIYSYLSAESQNSDNWPVYKKRSQCNIFTLDGKDLFRDEIGDGVWFWQNLPNAIYSTVIRSSPSSSISRQDNLNIKL